MVKVGSGMRRTRLKGVPEAQASYYAKSENDRLKVFWRDAWGKWDEDEFDPEWDSSCG